MLPSLLEAWLFSTSGCGPPAMSRSAAAERGANIARPRFFPRKWSQSQIKVSAHMEFFRQAMRNSAPFPSAPPSIRVLANFASPHLSLPPRTGPARPKQHRVPEKTPANSASAIWAPPGRKSVGEDERQASPGGTLTSRSSSQLDRRHYLFFLVRENFAAWFDASGFTGDINDF